MRRLALLLAICALAAVGCRGRVPVYTAADDVTTGYTLDQVELLGPVEGSSRRVRVFAIAFGEPKSFMDAQREALDQVGGELLFDSVRYDGRRGIVIPLGQILSLFVPGVSVTDVPVVVEEIWYVQGMAARYTGRRPRAPAGGN